MPKNHKIIASVRIFTHKVFGTVRVKVNFLYFLLSFSVNIADVSTTNTFIKSLKKCDTKANRILRWQQIDDLKEAPLTELPSNTFVQKVKKNPLISFSKDTRVFPAEVAAIHHFVREVPQIDGPSQVRASLFSDTQAKFKADDSVKNNSNLVWGCVSAPRA